MKRKVIIIISLVISTMFFIVPLILYFFIFNNGLSLESEDWGNYGSLLSGTIASFLSFISIILLVYTIREENKNRKEQRNENELKELGTQFSSYLNIMKSTFITKTFKYDFSNLQTQYNLTKDIDSCINDFILNKSGNKYFLIENIIIVLDKIKKLNKNQFEFYNNCISIEFSDILIKYLVLAINSMQYKNTELFKKFLFWDISIKPEILIKNFNYSRQILLDKSVLNGNYEYIEWK